MEVVKIKENQIIENYKMRIPHGVKYRFQFHLLAY